MSDTARFGAKMNDPAAPKQRIVPELVDVVAAVMIPAKPAYRLAASRDAASPAARCWR
jgi:hypothetical protein